ncbi:hypothetical protein K402DRAFT_439997 [Aulographum hederae CBS 113979]|uniref:Uncharacterized protein n=1 Tax=Aulographum hederae CBS 113979 TaxID=1176131 RepID=A0A6G1HBS1_9PEZI|nr:hypothetical protein K402DRAFT_439997 [Aulographum hederae CBS 113979]
MLSSMNVSKLPVRNGRNRKYQARSPRSTPPRQRMSGGGSNTRCRIFLHGLGFPLEVRKVFKNPKRRQYKRCGDLTGGKPMVFGIGKVKKRLPRVRDKMKQEAVKERINALKLERQLAKELYQHAEKLRLEAEWNLLVGKEEERKDHEGIPVMEPVLKRVEEDIDGRSKNLSEERENLEDEREELRKKR